MRVVAIVGVSAAIWLALLGLLCADCTDEAAARHALAGAGFTDVQTTGWNLMSCADDDLTATGFRATNPQGREVTGTVCCGFLKDCTIRYGR